MRELWGTAAAVVGAIEMVRAVMVRVRDLDASAVMAGSRICPWMVSAGSIGGERTETVTMDDQRAGDRLQRQMSASPRRPTKSEALDWLLRDLCEYGSPVAGSWAREAWPDSIETQQWKKKRDALAARRKATLAAAIGPDSAG